ncbi:MAG TPA: prepilin-type N-terminal cleavage/methylation domain-containing protein [Burkholderiaceae bacterium]|jgi:prepilin-type N-terminal cleavage/methylation domain-containing protein|nr:prepilin-type N-terminal cleavage/methylation domain-containing protein [Burkholderiaceae bacterium]
MKSRGFTLVEMLVTLVVVGLVSSLLWQALAAVAQLEGRLERTRTLTNDDQLRRAWVEQALSGVMAGADGDPAKFSGAASRLSAFTTMPPWPGSLGPEWMTLELDENQQGQRLLARRPGSDTPLELWHWAGKGGQFAYLDSSGNWHEHWPPRGARQTQALPSAIRLRGPIGGTVLVPVVATQGPMLRQQDLVPDTPQR